jgi:tetratricopeptide (TPR) repeat protein
MMRRPSQIGDMAANDPFSTLFRVVRKYRRDVHQLAEPAGADALAALEAHVGRRLPSGLRGFLNRHNGADLFRGALRIRSTSEVAHASDAVRSVLLFADASEGETWGVGRDADGNSAFGRWNGEHLKAQHGTFFGWLDATLEVLDARVTRREDVDAMRFEADPSDPHQLFLAGLRAMQAGRPEEAQPFFDHATRAAPNHVIAWQRLGDALTVTDRAASRKAWQRALRQARLPLPWPGAPTLDVEIFSSLARTYPEPESWERELERFLEERVHEVRTAEEFELLVAATTALADSLARRGKRTRARTVLSDLLSRSTLFEVRLVPWSAALALADLEIDLGQHDEAEKHLRKIRLEGPASLQGAALTLLGRLVITREEPWAEDILDEALARSTDADSRIRCSLLRVERAARQNRPDEARSWLERAHTLIEQGAPRMLRAQTALAEGDLHRLDEAPDPAHAAYRKVLDILGDRPAPELRLRVALRVGDLARTAGDLTEARACYSRAANGFAQHELPLREAWSLVRLAQVSDAQSTLLAAARSRFVEADLAAGVAVVDALAHAPARSLAWHLERASEHARARHNAQRSRPPWQRSDAERPERRLGAHRMAIAAGSTRVVDALATELEASSRAIRAGRGRPSDPPVLRYIAAVGLIAGHRSYQAANVLLHHLVDEVVDGPARHALQGAIARSPNAALVDGLLQCVENPGQMPAAAVAAAAEVLGMRREAEATAPLVELAGPSASPRVRKAVIVALGRIGHRSVVNHLVNALDEPGLAEHGALALLMLGDRRGIDFHVRALAEHRTDLSGHPGEIVGRYGGPSHLPALSAAAHSEALAVSLGALQGLGLMGDPRAIPTLIQCLDPRDPRRAEVASGALQILSGHLESAEDIGLQRRWQQWYEQHQGQLAPGVRHRDGRVHDAGALIKQMRHSDGWIRRTAYDELVITTGHRLPFDADGPWRTQLTHLRAWRSWWGTAKPRLVAGRWFLDGRQIG